jgi:hypothetical protein
MMDSARDDGQYPAATDAVIIDMVANLVNVIHRSNASSDEAIRRFDPALLGGTAAVDKPCRDSATDMAGQPPVVRWISRFPNEPYEVVKQIQVIIEKVEPLEFLASFTDANIAMSGESIEEAQLNLAAHILDVYETLRDENPELLGPEPQRQLRVLRQYLRER